MNEKGDIGVRTIIFGIVAVLVIAATLFGATNVFEKFGFYFGLISFNKSIGESEVSRVGINFNDDTLRYYTGTKWKEIDAEQEIFVLNEFEFDPELFKKDIKEFYSGERKPRKLAVDVNHWRYWSVEKEGGWKSHLIISHTKKWFEGDGLEYSVRPGISSAGSVREIGEYAYLKYDNSLKFDANNNIINMELLDLPMQKIVSWRDQILAGGKCEKYLIVGVKVGKIGERQPKNYKVNKRFEYLYIDLDEEVIGKNQEFDTCDEEESYDDSEIDRSDWENKVDKLEIQFNGLAPFGIKKYSYYSDLGWVFEKDGFWGRDGIKADSSGVDSKYSVIKSQDKLYAGLLEAVFTEKNKGLNSARNIQVTLQMKNRERKEVAGLPIGDKGVKEENRLEFVYRVLKEYNEYLRPKFAGEIVKIGERSTGFLFFEEKSREGEVIKFYSGLRFGYGEVRFNPNFDITWRAERILGSLIGEGKIGRVESGGKIIIERFPAMEELTSNVVNAEENYKYLKKMLDYINGKNIKEVFGEDVPADFYGVST